MVDAGDFTLNHDLSERVEIVGRFIWELKRLGRTLSREAGSSQEFWMENWLLADGN